MKIGLLNGRFDATSETLAEMIQKFWWGSRDGSRKPAWVS
jgi:hypothetical protein